MIDSNLLTLYLVEYRPFMSIPLVTRSNAAICDRSLGGIVGYSPAGAWMSASCERCVCC